MHAIPNQAHTLRMNAYNAVMSGTMTHQQAAELCGIRWDSLLSYASRQRRRLQSRPLMMREQVDPIIIRKEVREVLKKKPLNLRALANKLRVAYTSLNVITGYMYDVCEDDRGILYLLKGDSLYDY